MHRAIPITFLLAFAGCVAPVEPADVAVASYPAAFLVQTLVGDDLMVAQLAASGALHDFEPSARDLNQLRQSTHLILWDESLESWAHRAEESLGKTAPTVWEISRLPHGEDPLEADGDEHDDSGHGHSSHDPHTWNDPLAMRSSLWYLTSELKAAYPQHAAVMQTRAETLSDKLSTLHVAFKDALDACDRDTIVTNHEAHNYLAARYGFHLHALHGIEPGSQPSPATVNDAIQKIKEFGIPSIFIEEGTDPDTLQAIKDETGVQIRVLFTSESQPATGDYIDSQYQNLQEIKYALGCS